MTMIQFMKNANIVTRIWIKLKVEMNDANRAYKNRQYKTHINLNKSFKSIEKKN